MTTALERPARVATPAMPMLQPTEFEMYKNLAAMVAMASISTVFKGSRENAVLAFVVGHSLGIPPGAVAMKAYVTPQGKIGFETDLLLALALGRAPDFSYDVIAQTPTECTIEGRRGAQEYKYTYSMEDAKRAGLADKKTYKENPRDMLFYRCMGRIVRRLAPDAILGIASTGITSEELEINTTDREPSSATEIEAPTTPPAKSSAPEKTADESWVGALVKKLKWSQKKALDEANKALVAAGRLPAASGRALAVEDWRIVREYLAKQYDENGQVRGGAASDPSGAAPGDAPAPPASENAAGHSAGVSGTQPTQASDTVQAQMSPPLSSAEVVVDEEAPPEATGDEPPPVQDAAANLYADAVDGAEKGDRDSFLWLVGEAERRNPERKLVSRSPAGTLWFTDAAMLKKNGFTNAAGAVSQNVAKLSGEAIAALARDIRTEILNEFPIGGQR